jgi:hypothetical protein
MVTAAMAFNDDDLRHSSFKEVGYGVDRSLIEHRTNRSAAAAMACWYSVAGEIRRFD